MNFTMIDSPLDLKNTPRNLPYKQNSIKYIEDQNEDFIPDDLDEVPNRICEYNHTSYAASANRKEKISSPTRNLKRNSTFTSIMNSNSPKKQEFQRNAHKRLTVQSFVQIKLKRLNSMQQQSSILSLQNIDNSSNEYNNEKSSTQMSSPISSQFKKPKLQQTKTNNFFTEYYQNTIIEYID